MKQLQNLNFNLVALIALSIFLGSWAINDATKSDAPDISHIEFGSITIDDVVYEKDIVIENGIVRTRKKGPSKPFREEYGHTPLTTFEAIPWDCDTLVIGIGMSSRLPVVDEFKKMAKEKGVKLILLETPNAIKYFTDNYSERTNAIFHITC
jgi:hypothetical protein